MRFSARLTVIVAACLGSLPNGLMAQSVSFTEYPIPTAASAPSRIISGPDGALWFTEFSGNNIGRSTTAGAIVEYPVPTPASTPTGITNGPDGALWFTEQTGFKVGRITTAGVITEFPLPTPSPAPVQITVGPDGALWFAESTANKIGRITTAGVITEFPVPTTASRPISIATGPDAALWFTEQTANKIGRITTAGVITEFPVPTAASGPTAMAAGADGALWFAEPTANKIGRITTAGVITEFPVPTSASQVGGMTAGPDGALWFAEIAASKIGRITTAGVINEFPLPATGSLPNGITTGPDGALWFTEQGNANKIGRALPPSFAPEISLVANAFGETAVIAPNTWVEIKGSSLAPLGDARIWQGPDFANNQLPAQLDGVSVKVNGKNAFLYYISPAQVNILTPPDALPGSVQVQLTNKGVTSNLSTVQAQPLSLSFFEFVSPVNGQRYVYGRHTDSSLIGPANLFPGLTTPVKPGEAIYVAATGFGPTDVPVVSGTLAQSGNLPLPFPAVKIGGIQATVSFAGLIAVGTYQINLVVPPNAPDGDLALTATYNNLSIQPNLLITVQH